MNGHYDRNDDHGDVAGGDGEAADWVKGAAEACPALAVGGLPTAWRTSPDRVRLPPPLPRAMNVADVHQ